MINSYKSINWATLIIFSEDLILDFLLDDVSAELKEQITNQIESDETLREWYLKKKKEFDVSRYFDGELTLEEKLELEESLQSDKELREFFNLHSNINDFFKQMLIEEIFIEELEIQNNSSNLKDKWLVHLLNSKTEC